MPSSQRAARLRASSTGVGRPPAGRLGPARGPDTAAGRTPGDTARARRSSKPGSVRCSRPIAMRATANRRWPACASIRARDCCAAAKPDRRSSRRSGEEHAAQSRAARRRFSADAARPRQACGGRHRRDAEWIRGGAVWPSAETATPAPVASHERVDHAEQRAFWAFQPLAKPAAPAVQNAAWPRTDIDRFVLARLEREGLTPVGAADKLTLIRRATLDLTGLPPTPEEVDAFLADASPDAFDEGGRSPARVAALRRDVGPHVARRRALRRRRLSQPRSDGPRLQSLSERAPLSRLGDPRVQRRPAVRPVRHGAARRRPARRAGARAAPAGARLPRPRARGITTTAPSRSRAPTSATIASMRSAAAFSASRSAARAATITSTTRFRPRTTTPSPASSSTPNTASIRSPRRRWSTTTRRRRSSSKLKREMLSEYTATEAAPARRDARIPVGEVHEGGVAGHGRAEEGQAAIVDKREARLRAVRSLAGVPRRSGRCSIRS